MRSLVRVGARRFVRWAPAALAFLAAGCGGPTSAGTAQILAHDAPFTIASFPADEPAAAPATEQVADPARVAVPRLGISATLTPLGLGADGELVRRTTAPPGGTATGPSRASPAEP